MPLASAREVAVGYADDVTAGRIVAGRLVRLACVRFLDDLKTGEARGLRFNGEEAQRVVDFFHEHVHHVKGREWAGHLLHLEPWQVFILANLFGWQRRMSDGAWRRRFRKSYKQVGRKNAKTTLLSGIGLYLAFLDGEPGAEVYSAATKLDQAKICWSIARLMAQRDSMMRDALDIYGGKSPRSTGAISHADSGSKFEPVGADYDTLDGLNPHGALIDEVHAHKTSGVIDVLESGMGSRTDPLLCMITTAGYSKESPCWEERCYGEKILEGAVQDDTYFAFIAEPDEGDDWTNEACWAKGNPNLGVSVKVDYIRARVAQALETPAKQNDVKRKNLDIWTEQDTRWLPVEEWDLCRERYEDSDLEGCECYAGLDLASVKDTNALALIFPPEEPDGLWGVRLWCWLPAHEIAERERRDRAPYRTWAENGWLELTPGNIADYDVIRARIGALGEVYSVQEIGFDPWNATQLATQLMGDGFEMVQMRQGYKTLSEPMKRLEALVRSRKLDHGGNPLLRWMLSNVAIRTDANENIAPTKQTTSGRIDGIVATVLGLGRAIVQPEQKGSRYNRGGTLHTIEIA